MSEEQKHRDNVLNKKNIEIISEEQKQRDNV